VIAYSPSPPPPLGDLIKKLEKLKVENKKLKAKGKKGKTYSFSSDDGDSSYEEKVYKKGRKEETSMINLPITLCPLITIACLFLHHILSYLLAKLHILMGLTITN
jgi:hypothetical protein